MEKPVGSIRGPAPVSVLLIAAAVTTVAAIFVPYFSNKDLYKVFIFAAVVGFCAWLLDYSGKKHAQSHPHPLLNERSLPSPGKRPKVILGVATLLAAFLLGLFTASPDSEWGSPMPVFCGVGFFYLVVPQILARKAMRDYSQQDSQDA